MKSICLVVVNGGAASAITPEHVDCRIVDLDLIQDRGEPPTSLPPDIGFEQLVIAADLEEGVDFIWMKP